MGSRREASTCLLLAFALLGSCSSPATTLDGVIRTPPLEVATVSLPDAANHGMAVAMKAPADELYLVYFGYTSCPDLCPTTMSDISVAIGDLQPELARRVTVAMATVDPERDTDARLTAYLAFFFDHSMALRTADPAALRAATEAFGVRFEVKAHAPGDGYEVSHTAVTYVVDDTGTVVVEWPFGIGIESMTSDLKTLLARNST